MKETFDDKPVADGAIYRGRQPIRLRVNCEINQGASRGHYGEPEHFLAVNRGEVFRRVPDTADADDVATAWYDEVKRRLQREAVEAMKGGRCAAICVDRFADAGEQFLQTVEVDGLDAALVSASRTR